MHAPAYLAVLAAAAGLASAVPAGTAKTPDAKTPAAAGTDTCPVWAGSARTPQLRMEGDDHRCCVSGWLSEYHCCYPKGNYKRLYKDMLECTDPGFQTEKQWNHLEECNLGIVSPQNCTGVTMIHYTTIRNPYRADVPINAEFPAGAMSRKKHYDAEFAKYKKDMDALDAFYKAKKTNPSLLWQGSDYDYAGGSKTQGGISKTQNGTSKKQDGKV